MPRGRKSYQRHQRNRGQQLIGGAPGNTVGDITSTPADVGTSGGSGQHQVGATSAPSTLAGPSASGSASGPVSGPSSGPASASVSGPASGDASATTNSEDHARASRLFAMVTYHMPIYASFARENPNMPEEIAEGGNRFFEDLTRLKEQIPIVPIKDTVVQLEECLINCQDLFNKIHAFKEQQAEAAAAKASAPVEEGTEVNEARMKENANAIAKAREEAFKNIATARDLVASIAARLDAWSKELPKKDNAGRARPSQDKQPEEQEERAGLSRRTIDEARDVMEELSKLLLEDSNK
ncbi:hypothetical protein F5Y18DRAFT_424327 [Xylariaceae sp. FL1019]|nr:hypothetical protein F5Y18DRAFT_424327 [Xylariaceae sp. FL1019]